MLLKRVTLATACLFLSQASVVSAQEQTPVVTDQSTIAQLNSLALQISKLVDQQKFALAVPLARKALLTNKQAKGADDTSNVEYLNNLGWLLQQTGNYNEARRLFEEACALGEKHKVQDESYTWSLNNLGMLLYSLGDFESARPLFERALLLNQKLSTSGDARGAKALRNLAGVLDALGNGEKAIAAYREAIAITEKLPVKDDLELAAELSDLAQSLEDKERFDEALPLFERALKIRQEKLGNDNLDVADCMNNIGVLYLDTGKLDSARQHFEQSLAVYEKAAGSEHISVVPVLNNLGDLALLSKDNATAFTHYKRAATIINAYFNTILSDLSFAEQQAAMASYCPDQVSRLLSVSSSQDELTSSYAEIFCWKGMLVDSMSKESRLRRQAISEELTKDLEALSKVRSQLAGWYQEAGRIPYEQWKKENDQLTSQKEKLERAIAGQSPGADKSAELSISQLAPMLKPDEALMDIFRYSRYEGNLNENQHYGCMLTTGGESGAGTRQLIDLGEARKIDAEVECWRSCVTSGDEGDENWNTLTNYLKKPFQKLAPQIKKVWLCPDSELARVPWHLVNEKVGFEGETAAVAKVHPLVCQVDSIREFAALRSKGAKTDTPNSVLVAGGIDFDAGCDPANRGMLTFPALPATLKEANEVARLGDSAKLSVTSLSGAAATKAAVLPSLAKSSYIHLATHGFFFDETFLSSVRRVHGSQSATRGVALQAKPRGDVQETSGRNPLVESGIALAGANRPCKGGEQEKPGCLTAEELIGVDLSGCKLLTLSACDTGRGKELTGQGVMGLRSSLMAAGARSVLMSLWKVPDDPTAKLMKEFYTNLWLKHMSESEALSTAQKTLVQQAKTPADRLPINWAGWVLVGEGW